MRKFICEQPIEHDHTRFDVGAEISLPDEAVEPLLKIGHIAAIAPAKKGDKAAEKAAAEKTAAEKAEADKAEAERLAAEEAERKAVAGGA